jgi:hypothetical protein
MIDSKTRRPLSPTALTAEQYTQLMWDHLARLEGLGGRICSDPRGTPTMGVVIALETKRNGVFAPPRIPGRPARRSAGPVTLALRD